MIRDNHDDYRVLFEKSTMPMWVADEQTERFLAVNDAVVEKYGWSREELLQMRVPELALGSPAPSTDGGLRAYLPPPRPGVIVTGPFRHRRRDGGHIDVRVESTRITFENRAALLSTVIDETARRRLEERVHEADGMWRALVESSPDVVLVVDLEGTIHFINKVHPHFLGREVLGRKIWEFSAEGGKERLLGVFRKIAETREAFRYEGPGPDVPGETRWFEVSAIPLLLDGKVDRVLWIAADVTTRRVSLDKLAFQAQLLSQVSQPVVATDGTGRITYWNEAAERLYGWSAAEVAGKDSAELLQTRWLEPEGRDGFVSSVLANDGWKGELGHTTRRGDKVVVDASVRLSRDANGGVAGSIAVMSDVTGRKSLEAQLRQSQKLEAIGLLAGGVAHDFNNLLAIIMGFTEGSLRKLPQAHPAVELLHEVLDATRRGAELTKKLLAFSRRQVLEPRPVDVHAVVQTLTKLLERVLGEDVDLEVHQEGGPLVVRADTVQIEQVLLNFCTNARQAMPNGGRLSLRTRARVFDASFVARHPWSRVGAFAEIAVSDTGVGMDEATRARLFEPFFTTKPEGTGLGLATVYGIVKQHGGFVDVESSPGAGAIFYVYLPLLEPDRLPRPSEAPATPGGTRGRELVLLAEDDAALRWLVASTLADLGYRVLEAATGDEAVEKFAANAGAIAVVILDVVLPHLDVQKVYEKMRAIRSDVRIVLTTGYAADSAPLATLLRERGVSLLEKPFMPTALATKVRAAIDAA